MWNITNRDQNNSLIEIKLYFKNFLEVSGDNELDILEIRIPETTNFENGINSCYLKKNTKSTKQIPS